MTFQWRNTAVSNTRRMLELLGSRIALISDSALASITSRQSALVMGLYVHCIFSALPSSHDTHSSGPNISRVS